MQQKGQMGMKIAVPLNQQMTLYHDNPCTAPKFGIYTIEGDASDIRFSLSRVVENPWFEPKCNDFGEDQITCSCDAERRSNIRHICEHYALLDAVNGCSYLLADRYCENSFRALRNGGVKVFKIPPIIERIDSAIKNFLIATSLASKVQYIHNAS
jgi:predicted Fe-Mo cluster-binding NifX family protein